MNFLLAALVAGASAASASVAPRAVTAARVRAFLAAPGPGEAAAIAGGFAALHPERLARADQAAASAEVDGIVSALEAAADERPAGERLDGAVHLVNSLAGLNLPEATAARLKPLQERLLAEWFDRRRRDDPGLDAAVPLDAPLPEPVLPVRGGDARRLRRGAGHAEDLARRYGSLGFRLAHGGAAAGALKERARGVAAAGRALLAPAPETALERVRRRFPALPEIRSFQDFTRELALTAMAGSGRSEWWNQNDLGRLKVLLSAQEKPDRPAAFAELNREALERFRKAERIGLGLEFSDVLGVPHYFSWDWAESVGRGRARAGFSSLPWLGQAYLRHDVFAHFAGLTDDLYGAAEWYLRRTAQRAPIGLDPAASATYLNPSIAGALPRAELLAEARWMLRFVRNVPGAAAAAFPKGSLRRTLRRLYLKQGEVEAFALGADHRVLFLRDRALERGPAGDKAAFTAWAEEAYRALPGNKRHPVTARVFAEALWRTLPAGLRPPA